MGAGEQKDAPEPVIILLHEGVLSSLLKDGTTLGMLFALPWFNHVYCGGSAWINAAIAIAWFISILSKASGARRRFSKSPAEARAYLDEHFPRHNGGPE